MHNVDIIIPVWNLLETTRECLYSLVRNTEYPYRLIIIDNGSEPETMRFLKEFGLGTPNTTIIRNDANLGFVKAVNKGMEASSGDYICILNNDTVLTKGWLRELVDIMEADPSIGIANPSSNTSGQHPCGADLHEYAAGLKRYKGTTQELYTCRGFCMLVRRQVIDKLGPLDERYHMGYFDDTDYCKRVQRLGYRTVRSKASYVYHKENRSFALLRDNKSLFEKNEEMFFSRWGRRIRVGYFVDRPQEETRRRKLEELVVETARSGHQVLVFLREGLAWPVGLDHFDIRRRDVNRFFYGPISVYQILRRKRKKPLDVLLTDSRIFGAILKGLRPLHGAEVIVGPETKPLLDLLRKRSRSGT